MARRFLFVTWEGGGTTPPELAIARRLLRRGHAVCVLGDACLQKDVCSIGAEFHAYIRAPQRQTRTRESEIIADWQAKTSYDAFRRARDRHAYAPAERFARDVLDVLSKWPADCVVVDAMLAGGLVGAEASGLPFVAVNPMTSFLPGAGRPPPAIGLRPAEGPLGMLRDRILLTAGDWLLWRTCLPLLNDARKNVGLERIEHPLDQIRRAHVVLMLTDPHFDFNAPQHSGNIVYTGPELDDPVWSGASGFTWPWADDDPRPLLLVGLSSSYQAQEDLLSASVAAIERLPVRALVTLGPALPELPCKVPKNVRVCRSAPHSEVLPRVALTLTHGGHGTVIRSLAAGVPLLVFPMGRDQPDNAVRVEWLGAGRRLSSRSSAERIARAISEALANPALQRAARAFAAQLQAFRANHGDLSVEVLETLAFQS
jgi:UDP:flavonoid glycosyltransferase YjiC (YdhE family)